MFKCGPDYLDPTYHVRAAGSRSLNLDGWMMGRAGVLSTFQNACQEYDIALIEGVMGLFDGIDAKSDDGSTAQIAKWLAAPTILVVDASGMSRSVAALAQGFASFDSDLQVAGLICNRTGSKGHLELLAEASTTIPVLGGLPKDRVNVFPERHLGLRSASEDAIPQQQIDAWAAHVDDWCDIERLLEVARSGGPGEWGEVTGSIADGNSTCRIGVAMDEAFHFYYDENLRLLEQCGAQLVRFSPVHDQHLPAVDGLYLGGGYPEAHAEALADNRSMRSHIRAFCSSGKPVYAECGGLMYLCSAIKTHAGVQYPMVGWFSAVAEMSDRLQALGYVEVTTIQRSILGESGESFRGHQFRYSTLVWNQPVEAIYQLTKRRNGELFSEGYSAGAVVGSYVHSHWASNPRIALNLVEACAKARAHNEH
jgi:cobyrinic acid a,c-diamide synthase